ncbi:substrate-binding periplasmic protein [Inhella gelatinilytica]|uniref:Amino acid ABC transporter substrate-binding protein n=1 Tax=Inhella gelatinilytica TaxID=2795030 RepID=A0A931NDN8_9BURK|nr:transporter substrate-binding domain-containing protein [Inhella gelatinilytica]MBH9553277.1 amino acid ABC transporter substrate-binding protein [Inhella gelatinilytica]
MVIRHWLGALALWALMGGGSALACVKSVRWHNDPPYSYRGADGEITGLQVELARAVLQRLGCRMALVDMPFARALTELEAGRLDILPGAFQRPDREAFAHFSTVLLMQSRNLLFARKAAWSPATQIRDLEALVSGSFRLGAQIGVVYGEPYQALLQKPALAAKIQFGASRMGLWQMLARGRIDGLIADEATAVYELQLLGLTDQVVATDLAVSNDGAGSAFSRRSVSAEFVHRYDQALQAMQREGSLQTLLLRYGLRP